MSQNPLHITQITRNAWSECTEHYASEKPLDPKDRMNCRSAEKLFSENTTTLMINIPDSEGTQAYLNMGRGAVEAFLDRKFLPEERIRLWTSLFFYREWRKWVQNHPQYNLSKKFPDHKRLHLR